MAKLTDPEKLVCYNNALSNWRYEGFVFLSEVAFEWMKKHMEGISPRSLGRIMFEYVQAGGEIDQQKETRPEWSIHDWHYDLRIPVTGKQIYLETRLIYQDPKDPDDPVIHVVNIHEV